MIKPLTSLRFFFALMVFASHFCFFQSTDPLFNSAFKGIFSEGHLGVSFFFILSGFILSLNYKNRLISGEVSEKEFWVARVARIYPLHFFTLILSLPLFYSDFFQHAASSAAKFVANMLLLQSFIPVRDVYFSFNIPSWSISNEMFFYLLFPLIIGIYNRYRNAARISTFLLLLIPVGILICPHNYEHRFFYVNPFYRLSDFVIGILLFNVYEGEKLKSLFRTKRLATMAEILAVMVFIAFFAFHSAIPVGYRYSCYYWIPMIAIVFTFSFQAGYLSDFISKQLFVFLGEISYSFYLLHFLAIKYIIAINSKFSLVSNVYLLIGIVLACTLVGSYLSYRYIELPFNRLVKLKYKEVFVKAK